MTRKVWLTSPLPRGLALEDSVKEGSFRCQIEHDVRFWLHVTPIDAEYVSG